MNQELLRKRISNWLRQSKYRARQKDLLLDCTLDQVWKIFEDQQFKCIYCDRDATTADLPFPICDHGPLIPANIVPACGHCKMHKQIHDIIWMYHKKKLDFPRMQNIVVALMKRDQGGVMRRFIKYHMNGKKE